MIKPTRCSNFSFIFGIKLHVSDSYSVPSSGVFHCTHSKPVWHTPLLCVQWKTPDDGQSNCPKHVEFYSKNKFEELVHLVGFIIRIYHDARSPERQIQYISFLTACFGFYKTIFRPNVSYWFSYIIIIIIIIIIIMYLYTAIWLLPGGSGYFTCSW